MRCLVLIAGVVLSPCIVSPAAAQQALAGRWTTEFDIGIRNINGVEMSEGKRQARITLSVTGDSVHGTWEALGTGPAVTRRLHGTSSNGQVSLVADTVDAVLRDGGDERHVKMIPSYHFVQRGDSLVGTLQTSSADGTMGGPTRPFVATRAR